MFCPPVADNFSEVPNTATGLLKLNNIFPGSAGVLGGVAADAMSFTAGFGVDCMKSKLRGNAVGLAFGTGDTFACKIEALCIFWGSIAIWSVAALQQRRASLYGWSKCFAISQLFGWKSAFVCLIHVRIRFGRDLLAVIGGI